MPLPQYGVNPDDSVALVVKMITQCKQGLDNAFPPAAGAAPGTSFSENNPDIFSILLQMMHNDYLEAVRVAQRQSETGHAAQP